MGKFLVVGIGGFMGSILRFSLATISVQSYGNPIPLRNIWNNVTGSFLIGFVMTVLTEKNSI